MEREREVKKSRNRKWMPTERKKEIKDEESERIKKERKEERDEHT